MVRVENAAHVVHCRVRARFGLRSVRCLGCAASFHVVIDRRVDVAAVAQPPFHDIVAGVVRAILSLSWSARHACGMPPS